MTTPTEDQLIALVKYWEECLWEEHRFYVQQFVDDDGTTRWEALCWRTDGRRGQDCRKAHESPLQAPRHPRGAGCP